MRASFAAPLLLLWACSGAPGGDPAASGADGADGASDGSDGASDGSDGTQPDDDLVGAHDGSYTITMARGGDHFALGVATIERNRVSAEMLSNAGLAVTVTGRVGRSGVITVTDANANDGSSIGIVEATVTRGVLEAVYTVDGDEGVLVGTRDGELLVQTPVQTFDGSYELALVRDDVEVSNTVLDIRRGAFSTSFTTEEAIFNVNGFVTSDGVLVVNSVTGGAVQAEATIDQDTLEIEGIYRSGDRVGRVVGRRSD
jgi:hypothetical protein